MALRLTQEEYKALLGITKKSKETKYHSQQITVGGKAFDSVKEGTRYSELVLAERAGEISELKCQVPFELIPTQREPSKVGPRGGVKKGKLIEQACVYIADFVYKDKSGAIIVEDTKGCRTPDYIIKRKLMLYVHNIRIKET